MAVIQNDTQQLVLFRLGSAWYGVHVSEVHGIVATPAITPLPFVPPTLRGIAAIRGEMLAIIDLHIFLGQPAAAPVSPHVMMVHADGLNAGVLVDAVTDVVGIMIDAHGRAVWDGQPLTLLAMRDVLRRTQPVAVTIPRSKGGAAVAEPWPAVAIDRNA